MLCPARGFEASAEAVHGRWSIYGLVVGTAPFSPLAATDAALVAASVARVQGERSAFAFRLLRTTAPAAAATLTTTILQRPTS